MFDELTALEPVEIATVVTRDDVLDFVVLYQSLAKSWTFYPFRLHAFTVETEAHERLAALELPDVAVHSFAGGTNIELVELSGLERCLVSDVDNVFVAETPELSQLLDHHELVFVAAPPETDTIATSLWGFRRTGSSIAFAKRWQAHSSEGDSVETEGVPLALLEQSDDPPAVKVLARPKPDKNSHWQASPYAVRPDLRPFDLRTDALGFREEQMGRAKVFNLAGLRGRGSDSLEERVEVMIRLYPSAAQFLSYYFTLANRAAARLGLERIRRPSDYLSARLFEQGILAHRNHLPDYLNSRGLVGIGVEVGVRDGSYSEHLLRKWQGERLISIDPWRAVPADGHVEMHVSQEQHERYYELARERLAQFGDRSQIWRETSVEGAARIEPASLDFVYIDARHNYDSVSEDLEHWYGKVRPGGLIAGHDYLDADRAVDSFRVRSAVDDFFGARGLAVRSTYADLPWSSWIVEVPRTDPASVTEEENTS